MKILFSVAGWFLWNFAIFNLDKNKDDEAHRKFGYGQYAADNWENWAGSLILNLVLFLIMKLGYGIDILAMTNLDIKWTDALIGFSGPGYEIVLWGVGKIKSKFPKAQP